MLHLQIINFSLIAGRFGIIRLIKYDIPEL
jgi:hypothetical protein